MTNIQQRKVKTGTQ